MLRDPQIKEFSLLSFKYCNILQPHVYYYKFSVVGSVDLHG